MPPGLTTFTPIALRGVHRPGDVVADLREVARRRAAFGEQLQEQLVVAEHHVGAVVERSACRPSPCARGARCSAPSPARRRRCSPSRHSGSRWPACPACSVPQEAQLERVARAARSDWRRRGGLRASAARARLTLPPPMWVCMSMPPAITTQPLASISWSKASPAAGATMRPSRTRQVAPLPGAVVRRVDDQAAAQQQAAHAAPPSPHRAQRRNDAAQPHRPPSAGDRDRRHAAASAPCRRCGTGGRRCRCPAWPPG